MMILWHFPHVVRLSFKPAYDKVMWLHDEKGFERWCEGKTGIPILDAAQRQLTTIGWVHNRGRMIASSMLTKLFMIDWRKGERFYAQHLVDYDVANNNSGWLWSSGGGSDAQPWFRYFNPFLQSKEHDPKCEYIKTWIPELKDVDPKVIHNWETEWVNYKDTKYPKPICDYSEQKDKVLKMYKDALY